MVWLLFFKISLQKFSSIQKSWKTPTVNQHSDMHLLNQTTNIPLYMLCHLSIILSINLSYFWWVSQLHSVWIPLIFVYSSFLILTWDLHIMKCTNHKCFIWQLWKSTHPYLLRIRTLLSSWQVPPVSPWPHTPLPTGVLIFSTVDMIELF